MQAGINIPKIQGIDNFKQDLQFTIIDTVSPVAITSEGRQGAILPIIQWHKYE